MLNTLNIIRRKSTNISSDFVLPTGSISKERVKQQLISPAVSNAANMQLCQSLCAPQLQSTVDICYVRRSLNALQSQVTYWETSTQHTKKLGGFVSIK